MQQEVCEKCKPLFEELEKKFLKIVKALEKRIEELEEKEKSKPDWIKDPINEKPKKTGQKKGHKGYSRNIPERIDEIK